MSGIYAFGDSYLDSGTALAVSAAAVAARVPDARLLPAAPDSAWYAPGRWSDGPSMVECLAASLGLPLVNYAIGGARAAGGNYHAWLAYFVDTGLASQVESFEIGLRGSRVPDCAIYVLAAGANDYFQYQDFHQPGYIALTDTHRLSAAMIAARAARCVANAVERLGKLGARRFIVSGAYALELVPFVTTVEPQVEAARGYAQAFDLALADEIARLAPAGHDVRVVALGAEMRRLASPTGGAFAEPSRPCQPMLPVPGPRNGPAAQFFWWDEFHPSGAAHRLLGDFLLKTVQAADWV